MVVKVQTINFWCILTQLLGWLTLVMGFKIRLWDDSSSADFIYLILLSSRIVWIDKLHDLMKGFYSNKGAMKIVKIYFFSYLGNDCLEEKLLGEYILRKSKKYNNFIFCSGNFALEIETGWAKFLMMNE